MPTVENKIQNRRPALSIKLDEIKVPTTCVRPNKMDDKFASLMPACSKMDSA